jgi:hypothetical protein
MTLYCKKCASTSIDTTVSEADCRHRCNECLTEDEVSGYPLFRYKCDKGHDWISASDEIIIRGINFKLPLMPDASDGTLYCPLCLKEKLFDGVGRVEVIK